MTAFDELDNPVWMALTTGHLSLARSSGVARRYESDVSPLAGLREPTRAAFSDLSVLVDANERVGLFTAEPLQVPREWEVVRSRQIDQMVYAGLHPTSPGTPLSLHSADVPEMLALAAATDPGPFLAGTIRMGRYYGVRSGDGRLIAMAGERLQLDTFTEISAVCTSPEFRSRGHARALVTFLVAQSLSAGRVPFLHVKSENGAKALYEQLGFQLRRGIQLTVIAPK